MFENEWCLKKILLQLIIMYGKLFMFIFMFICYDTKYNKNTEDISENVQTLYKLKTI